MTTYSYTHVISLRSSAAAAMRFVVGLSLTLVAVNTVQALTTYEADQMTFMKEEEKLARDVYTTLGTHWDLPIFGNIARSEQTHMDRMDTLLVTYGLPDPASAQVGVFTNPVLQHLYDRLVDTGRTSPRAALGVGEMIEITDIRDLTALRDATELADVISTADRLRNASYNHLAAFRSQLALLPPVTLPESNSQLVNLSARGVLGEGDESLIVGFVIQGDTSLRMLLTTRGPSLEQFGIADYAGDPSIQLFAGAEVIAANDNWATALDASIPAENQIFALASPDAALLVTLDPGAYTVIAANAGNGRTGLSEIYALPEVGQTSRLLNLSVRGKTESGDGRLIAGFIVTGEDALPVQLRALGPTLISYQVDGTADDLDLEIFDQNATPSPQHVSDWLDAEVLGTIDSAYWPETPLEPLTLTTVGPGAVTVHAIDPLGIGGITLIDVTIF